MKVKLPSNEVILYALALAGALTFAYAFIVMDGAGLFSAAGILLLARGIVLGVAAGLGMAKIANAIPRSNKSVRPWLYASFGLFLIVSPLIISPVTFATMSPEMLTLPLWVRVLVAIAAGLFVDALTAGVSFASGKLEADEKPAQAPQEQTVAKPKRNEAAHTCSICGWSSLEAKEAGKNEQKAYSGHMLKHKPIPVSPSSVFSANAESTRENEK